MNMKIKVVKGNSDISQGGRKRAKDLSPKGKIFKFGRSRN